MTIPRGFVLGLVLLVGGCSKAVQPAPKAHLRPEVRVIDVTKRTIVRFSEQPGFAEAYEQTSLFPKVSGFVDEWTVDIGDVITKDKILVHLDIPDLRAEYEEKKAEVEFAQVRVKVAEELAKVATENWKNAVAQVAEAKANLGRYAADVERWRADFRRIDALYKSKSIEEPVLDESRKHLDATIAAQKAADAGIVVAQTNAAARKADMSKAEVDVEAARASTRVARAKEKRLAALVSYTSIKAPYDGVVVARNVNTGDFVQPASGDQSAPRSIQEPFGSRGKALYVVARTDKVRIYLDVPEMEASGVRIGNKAWVTVEADNNTEFPAQVTRTSWALNAQTRTLRAEIDVPNPGGRILPNMYVYGKVEIKRSDVFAVPLEAITELGNQTSCYEYLDGKAVLLPVQRGLDDGAWVELVKKRVKGVWTPLSGSERIILGNLSQISDGEQVRLESTATSKN